MNRRDKVLKLIVEHFIKNAQPVGSKTLIDEYGLDYSSATIRSEMNALEQDGYLEKTHTSSGRVPSSKGYRYYIEHLREGSIDQEFKYQMQSIFDQKVQSIQDVISQSCEILSQMTNLASIVLGPNSNDEHLVSVQLVPISETSATCVFVTDQGYVGNKTFLIEEKSKLQDVEKCVKLFNDRLKGTPISELLNKMKAIRPLLNDLVIDHDIIYSAMVKTFMEFAKDRLFAFGKEELFTQPEFANDAAKIKRMIELFDRPDIFREVEENTSGSIAIHIGGETNGDDDVSIVQAKLKMPGQQERSIAVVGPKRMDYDKVVTSLEYLINQLGCYRDDASRKEANSERKEQRKYQNRNTNKRRNHQAKSGRRTLEK